MLYYVYVQYIRCGSEVCEVCVYIEYMYTIYTIVYK